MNSRNSLLKLSILTLIGVLITVPLTACRFCPPAADELCRLLGGGQLRDLTSSDQKIVFEEQGTIIVYHGFACAESNRDGEENILKVEQSLDLPSYATNATVFLNGWRVKYLSDDAHVAGLGTTIGNITQERNTLKWQASGILSDEDFEKAYSWCYSYTVVAWNPTNLNLAVDHKDGSCDLKDKSDPSQANFYGVVNNSTTTALSSFSSFLQNPVFASSKTVAILPRGFGFGWRGCLGRIEDHHLLQIGYNLDHSEVFVEKGKKYHKRGEDVFPSLANAASQVGSGFVSWETSAIFKDNEARRDYSFGEIVSGLVGNDVGVIQPPFSILPIEDHEFGFSTCVSSGSGVRTQEFVIEKVPFDFAIPMLTGWDLAFQCDDSHLTEGGIWIDEWSYDKTTRTLRYKLSSILRDRKAGPGFDTRHKVTILGLRPVGGNIPSEKVPDLLPFSPAGKAPVAFCRIEQSGTQLRVTVKNQGNENAAASKTTVTFGNVPVIVDTPPIPAGGSVDLLFRVPANCFTPDCSFRITVDSGNQVNESSNEGNNSANGGCIG